jgi:hypothetical protein
MWFRLLLVVALLFAVVKVLPFAGPQKRLPRKTVATDPATGNTYKIVWGHMTWQEAREQAQEQQFGGLNGHLATITSPEEQAFLEANFWIRRDEPLFIAASDAEHEGVWKWTDGPEAGTIFFADGRAVNGQFAQWDVGEPNNQDREDEGGEDCAVWNWKGDKSWNDLAASNRDWVRGYLVEFSVPESVRKQRVQNSPPRHTFLLRESPASVSKLAAPVPSEAPSEANPPAASSPEAATDAH